MIRNAGSMIARASSGSRSSISSVLAWYRIKAYRLVAIYGDADVSKRIAVESRIVNYG